MTDFLVSDGCLPTFQKAPRTTRVGLDWIVSDPPLSMIHPQARKVIA